MQRSPKMFIQGGAERAGIAVAPMEVLHTMDELSVTFTLRTRRGASSQVPKVMMVVKVRELMIITAAEVDVEAAVDVVAAAEVVVESTLVAIRMLHKEQLEMFHGRQE